MMNKKVNDNNVRGGNTETESYRNKNRIKSENEK